MFFYIFAFITKQRCLSLQPGSDFTDNLHTTVLQWNMNENHNQVMCDQDHTPKRDGLDRPMHA